MHLLLLVWLATKPPAWNCITHNGGEAGWCEPVGADWAPAPTNADFNAEKMSWRRKDGASYVIAGLDGSKPERVAKLLETAGIARGAQKTADGWTCGEGTSKAGRTAMCAQLKDQIIITVTLKAPAGAYDATGGLVAVRANASHTFGFQPPTE
jgi:hypothetical protein